MKLTANSRVSIQRGSEPPTLFGLIAQGLGAWSLNDRPNTRAIPTLRGIASTQLLDTRTGNVGFNVDDNASSAPLLFLASGHEFTVIVYPEGNASGSPQITVKGSPQITLSNPEGGIRGYRFDMPASSVVYGTVT